MIGDFGEVPDFAIGQDVSGREITADRRHAAGRVGTLALRAYSLVDSGVRVGMTIAMIAGNVFVAVPEIAALPSELGAGQLPGVSETMHGYSGSSHNDTSTDGEVIISGEGSDDSGTLPNTGG